VLPIPRVLIVEDDDSIRGLLVTALRREPLLVDSADDGEEALTLTAIHDYAVIVLDLMMPRLDGFAFLERFHGGAPRASTVIFIVTAFDDLVFERIPAQQAHAIIRKPFDVLRLSTTVAQVALALQSATKPAAEMPPPDEHPRAAESIC